MAQRTGKQPGETQEEPGLVSPHSARNLQVPQMTHLSTKSERKRVKWPAANKASLWNQLDEDIDQILEAIAGGDVDRKLQAMTAITVSLASERFGEEQGKGGRRPYSKNEREAKIHIIRQELKALRHQYKQAGEEEHIGLAQLTCILRKKILVLRRADWHRRHRRERARKRTAFIANPYKFTKELLGQKRSGRLVCSQAEIDHHMRQTYSDPAREQELGECSTLINPPEPRVQFDTRATTERS